MKKIQKSRVLDMTKGSPFLLLLHFSLPLFLGNLLQQFYNLTDTAIAGHILGDEALAQIGATAALYILITNFAFGLNTGLALTVSQHFGAGNRGEIKHAVCWMVILSGAFSVVLTVGFLLFRNSILIMMQIPEGTMMGALSYFTVILAGIPLTMAYNLESSLLQAVGNSIVPLIFLLFSSILNVGLDFLFMGLLTQGVQGAAIATVLAQGISAGLGFVYIRRNYPELYFGKQELHVKAHFVLEMFWRGVSMALMSTIYNIGSVILQSSINALGSVYIAAQVCSCRLTEVFYIPGLALGTGVATYSSQNYGAGSRSRISKGIRASLYIYGIWWLAAMVFTFLFAPATIKLITGSDNRDIIFNAVRYLRMNIPLIPPMAVLVILRNALQGMRHQITPLLCSMLELIGKLVFALWIVPIYGYLAVCVCEPITWIVCCVFILAAVFLFRREFEERETK